MTFTRRFSRRFFSEAIPDRAVRAIAFAEQPRPHFELDPENPKLARSTPIAYRESHDANAETPAQILPDAGRNYARGRATGAFNALWLDRPDFYHSGLPRRPPRLISPSTHAKLCICKKIVDAL